MKDVKKKGEREIEKETVTKRRNGNGKGWNTRENE